MKQLSKVEQKIVGRWLGTPKAYRSSAGFFYPSVLIEHEEVDAMLRIIKRDHKEELISETAKVKSAYPSANNELKKAKAARSRSVKAPRS